MLCGRQAPELGGDPRYLDVIGVNYYPWNQWIYNGPTEDGTTIGPSDRRYRPFRDMLREHGAVGTATRLKNRLAAGYDYIVIDEITAHASSLGSLSTSP